MERLYEHWIDPRGAFEGHLQSDDLGHYAEYAQDVMQLLAFVGRVAGQRVSPGFRDGLGSVGRRWPRRSDATPTAPSCPRSGVAYAQANGIKVVDWDDIPGHGFDVINADQVFEHIPNPLETLNHLKKGLAPGGIIKIDVPRPADIDRTLAVMDWTAAKYSKNSLNDVAPLEHINCFRQSSLRELAKQAGMKQVYLPVGVQYRHLTHWTGSATDRGPAPSTDLSLLAEEGQRHRPAQPAFRRGLRRASVGWVRPTPRPRDGRAARR